MTEQVRKEVVMDEVSVAKWIKDGMDIGIGGFINSSHPMAIVRQIIKNKVKDLTVVGAASAGLEVDLLISAGCVKKVITSYVGAEELAPVGPCFRRAAQNGEIEVWDVDEGQYYAGLRAAAQRLPFMPWLGGLGTSITEINPDIKVFNDPIKGKSILAIPAIEVDITIIHAAYADPYGNIQFVGTGFGDRAIARAADVILVEVEKIIPNVEIRRNPEKTAIRNADAVVRAPYGAHPFSSPGFYLQDNAHLKEYLKGSTSFLKNNDRGFLDQYLQKYIYEPESHVDYLERIGVKRLISLYEY
jgi:glutaconate CoA-transferase subunit A